MTIKTARVHSFNELRRFGMSDARRPPCKGLTPLGSTGTPDVLSEGTTPIRRHCITSIPSGETLAWWTAEKQALAGDELNRETDKRDLHAAVSKKKKKKRRETTRLKQIFMHRPK